MVDQETITAVPDRNKCEISGPASPELWLPVPIEKSRQPVNVWESIRIGMAWAVLLTFSITFWTGLIYFLF